VRLQAARLFEQDMDAGRIARIVRVSTKSVYQWRRPWRAVRRPWRRRARAGPAAKLDERQVARLAAALDAGPAAYGWDTDQR
jgi:transposase